METAKQAGNFVSEKIQEATSGTSKETNKQVAKDGNVPLGTRAEAAKDAVSDKIDETGHGNKADVHKEFVKH